MTSAGEPYGTNPVQIANASTRISIDTEIASEAEPFISYKPGPERLLSDTGIADFDKPSRSSRILSVIGTRINQERFLDRKMPPLDGVRSNQGRHISQGTQ